MQRFQQGIGAQATVCGRTGPGVVAGLRNEASPHRVQLHVPDRVQKMPVVQSRGVETVLPHVPGSLAHAIDSLRVLAMNRA